MGEMRNVHKILIGKHEGKRPPGRRRRLWENAVVKRKIPSPYGDSNP
jgi:hypothetical protein